MQKLFIRNIKIYCHSFLNILVDELNKRTQIAVSKYFIRGISESQYDKSMGKN